MVIYRCWCWVESGQDSFVAVAEMTLVASAVDEMALVAAAADMAVVIAVAEMALVTALALVASVAELAVLGALALLDKSNKRPSYHAAPLYGWFPLQCTAGAAAATA